MKKLLTIALLACGLAALASAAQPANVLETSTNARTGNATTLSVGGGTFRKLPDGGVVVTAALLVVVTDSEGNEIKRTTEGADIVVVLTPQQAGPMFALFSAAYTQQKAEAAEAAAAAEAKAKADAEAAAKATPKTTGFYRNSDHPTDLGSGSKMFFGSPARITLTAAGNIEYTGTPDAATDAFIAALQPKLQQLYASAR